MWAQYNEAGPLSMTIILCVICLSLFYPPILSHVFSPPSATTALLHCVPAVIHRIRDAR